METIRTFGALSSGLPILDPQPGHAREFSSVMGDQDQVAGAGLTSDQYVVWTDRRPPCRQNRSDFTGLSGIFFAELHDWKLQCIDKSDVPARPLALERAIE